MGSKVKQLLGAVAPLAGFIPGLQPLAAVGLGAGLGALSGGGLRGALTGGLGAAIPGYSGALGNALGVSGAAGSGVGGALLGAGAGAAKGGLSNALLGGLGGGVGGYAGAGGFSGLSDSLGLTGEDSLFGTSAGTPLGHGLQGPTQGSGLLGSATRGISDIGSALSTGTGGGGSSYGSGLASLLGGASSINANNNAEKDLLNSQQQALSRYQPYVDAKFNPGDLTQDPGYQFRLQQGEQAIGRQQAAKGGYFSGAALKAAQDYGQGLADTTYNEAYNRWSADQNRGIGVAGSLAGLDQEGGNVRAAAGIGNSNAINRSLSGLLGGYGAYSPYSNPYYRPQYGY
jgi:hypothetical protein